MKNQLENLVALAKIIDMDLFYVVSFRGDQITLQGSISKEAVKAVVNAGYSLISNKEGWLDYTSVELRIVLT
jgi:hypothetical protein